MMTSSFRVMLLVLGAGVITVWTAVVFLYFSNEPSPAVADNHQQAQIGIMVHEDWPSDAKRDKSARVYAINDKQAYNARQLSDVTKTDESGKVSIDTLLEQLKIE